MKWVTDNQEYTGQWECGVQVLISSPNTFFSSASVHYSRKAKKGVLCGIKGAL